jgi:hypothetical protein
MKFTQISMIFLFYSHKLHELAGDNILKIEGVYCYYIQQRFGTDK